MDTLRDMWLIMILFAKDKTLTLVYCIHLHPQLKTTCVKVSIQTL